jgi:predicted  nucleic acid-binding Zn-ribbon protein
VKPTPVHTSEDQLREEIGRLISLQNLDRELQESAERLAAVTQGVDKLREETMAADSEIERLTAEQTQAELVRRQLERDLAEGESRIRNSRMRQSLIRNEKELQALAHEVETQKESNQRLEAELLMQMEASEPRTARLRELAETLEKRRAELAAAEREIAGRAEELKELMRKRRVERDLLAAQIDASLRARYEMIFSRRGGLAVTLARGGTCQGCRMRLPPQLYNEIQKFQQIHSCPNCQRILYFEPAVET